MKILSFVVRYDIAIYLRHVLMKNNITNNHTSILHFTFLVCHVRGHLYYAVCRSGQKRQHIQGHLTHAVTALMVALFHVSAKISGIRDENSWKRRLGIPETIMVPSGRNEPTPDEHEKARERVLPFNC